MVKSSGQFAVAEGNVFWELVEESVETWVGAFTEVNEEDSLK